MILRRVIHHVKNQHWTAVFLDFVIVVLGVFVGIQVSNWNAARALKAQERSQLSQLLAEIIENDKVVEYQTAYSETSVESGRRALAYLEGGEDCVKDCGELLIDFFHASQLWGSSYPFAKFREAERLGFPSDEKTRSAVQRFYLYIAGSDTINLTPPAYRERVRGHFSPDAAAMLWNNCFLNLESQLEALTRDCAADLASLDTAEMLRSIRADTELANQLRFWIGQNIFALRTYPDARTFAAEAENLINGQIGARK